jgi:DNA-binding HxlR family transcriptional regulator
MTERILIRHLQELVRDGIVVGFPLRVENRFFAANRYP